MSNVIHISIEDCPACTPNYTGSFDRVEARALELNRTDCRYCKGTGKIRITEERKEGR